MEDIQEYEYADRAMKTMAAMSVRQRLQATSYNDVISICHSIQERLRVSCIRGFGAGLIEFGEPGKEHIKSLVFCSDPSLRQDEREACLHDVNYVLDAIKMSTKPD